MAVAPTGAIFKSLIFDGKSLRNYGVYITGEAVYNAPARDVEMVSIPGRNGSFALDNGRFENIEVNYPAGIFAETEADFAEAISDFRNFLCSRKGYVRLTDDYNPNEYRMAIYKSGLEVKPAQLKAGEFNIVFDCKPQRWLTSGEEAITVADGETLINPTLFGSSPLIRCNGYGQIAFGGAPIKVESVPIGDILLSSGSSFSKSRAEYNGLEEQSKITLDVSQLNTGDNIFVAESTVTYTVKLNYSDEYFTRVYIELESGESWETSCAISAPRSAYFRTRIPALTFENGTAATKTYLYTMDWEADGVSASAPIEIEMSYDGANTITLSAYQLEDEGIESYSMSGGIGQINGYSTIIIDDDVIIDLDIGEAYFDDASHTSANYSVSMPAELPTLAPGANIVSYDSTFTTMEITPRWWKI